MSKGSAVGFTVAAPKAVDLTSLVTIRDVGQEGTVAAAACITAMDASLAAQGRPLHLSLRYLHEKAKRHDEVTGEGTFLPTTIYVATQFGAPPESQWPYRALDRSLPKGTSWSDLDRAAARTKARLTQVADLGAVLGALERKTPVIVAVSVASDWFDERATRTGLIDVGSAPTTTRGLSVVTLVGYDPATGRYKFANQWGTGWGDKGFGYLSTPAAKALLQFDSGLWAVLAMPAAE